jgi:hypothetical protein
MMMIIIIIKVDGFNLQLLLKEEDGDGGLVDEDAP